MSSTVSHVNRLPAEWEPQKATLLVWPHADTDWVENLADVEQCYAQIAQEISQRQAVLLVIAPHLEANKIQALLYEQGANLAKINCFQAQYNDTWVRDYGPICIDRAAKIHWIDFRFNAWGGKFSAGLDDQICQKLYPQHPELAASFVQSDTVLEGGAIETDGAGTLLMRKSAVIDDNRNPCLSQAQIELELHKKLGAKRILWLEHGYLSGDDTDGHIDTLARFLDPETLCYVTAEKSDPDWPELNAMAEELALLTTASGKPYRLVPLPPSGAQSFGNRRLPASYANFLFVNQALLVPIYGAKNDQAVLDLLQQHCKDRQVIGLDCRALIRQNGSLHCVTMQLF